MAKTIAELSAYCARLEGRLQVVDGLTVDIQAAADDLSERQHDHRLDVVRLREQTDDQRRQQADMRGMMDRMRDDLAAVRLDLAALRQEDALLRQRLDDHLKRVELWDNRRWGLIISVALAVFGVAASFTSGLILATLRTMPR